MLKKIRQKLPKSIEQSMPWLFISGGIIGLYSSLVLTYDKMEYLKNPDFQPNCNLDPVLSCGTVMVSEQANVFGFPNPWIGIITFSMLITIGLAILAGATFKRWFWIGIEIGMLLGLGFAMWLLQQSIYSIEALCPYCLAVDVAVITMFWYTTLYLIKKKFLAVPKQLKGVPSFAQRHHLDILLVIFVLIIAIILQHFWYYYGEKLSF